MAVYTHLGAEDIAGLIAAYDVGTLVCAKGIAEGVSNSNWLIDTTGASGRASGGPSGDAAGARTRYILTMYEFRIDLDDLPYFLSLLDHLAAHGCPVPRTIHDRGGALYRRIAAGNAAAQKAVALIEFLPGASVGVPTPGRWAPSLPGCIWRQRIFPPAGPMPWALANGGGWPGCAAMRVWPRLIRGWRGWWRMNCRASPATGPPICPAG